MIPFFDELARVTAAGGHVAIAYSMGPRTPIWVPLERFGLSLERRGFVHVADFAAGTGVALLARRGRRVRGSETFATRYHRSGRLFSCGYTFARAAR